MVPWLLVTRNLNTAWYTHTKFLPGSWWDSRDLGETAKSLTRFGRISQVPRSWELSRSPQDNQVLMRLPGSWQDYRDFCEIVEITTVLISLGLPRICHKNISRRLPVLIIQYCQRFSTKKLLSACWRFLLAQCKSCQEIWEISDVSYWNTGTYFVFINPVAQALFEFHNCL